MTEPCDSCPFTQYPYAVHPNCSHLPACPRNLVGQLREEIEKLKKDVDALREELNRERDGWYLEWDGGEAEESW